MPSRPHTDLYTIALLTLIKPYFARLESFLDEGLIKTLAVNNLIAQIICKRHNSLNK